MRNNIEVIHQCSVDPTIESLLVPFGYLFACKACGKILNDALDSGGRVPYQTLADTIKAKSNTSTKPVATRKTEG